MAPTSDSLWIHSLFRATLCLLFITGALGSAITLVDCKKENGQLGTTYCKDAFKATCEQNKLKLLGSPKTTGCCLSEYLGICIKHAWAAAQCDPKDQKIAILIRDEVAKAQESINKLAQLLATNLCGEVTREKCGEALLHNFDVAISNITTLNGAIQVGPSSIYASSLVALLGTLYGQLWL